MAAILLTYDPKHNIAYLRLREKIGPMETIHLSGEVYVEIAPDGTVYGIELLNANEQLGGMDKGKFVLVNEEKGNRQEIALDG